MRVASEIHAIRQRIDATFERAGHIEDLETQADMARYICVLVSGLLERSASEALLDYTARSASPVVQRYVEARLDRFTNAKASKILNLFGDFNPDWRECLDTFIVDERKTAIDSVIANRHLIAHGRSVGLSLGRIREYSVQVDKVVDKMLELCECHSTSVG